MMASHQVTRPVQIPPDARDAAAYDVALKAARVPLPRDLGLDELLDAWCLLVRAVNALGGWYVRRGFNEICNPNVFETYEGTLLRHRARKLEERIVVARRGDRKRGPCPVCKEPYDYELLGLYRNEGRGCGGCEDPCPYCEGVHEQSSYGHDAHDCVKHLAKQVRAMKGHP